MEDDTIRVDRAGCVDRVRQRRDRLLVELVVWARDVAEVDRVYENRLDTCFARPRREAGQHLGVVIREAPRPRALDEELERIRADLLGTLRSSLDAARDVAAEEHPP